MEFVRKLKRTNAYLNTIISNPTYDQYDLLAYDIKKDIIYNTNSLRNSISKLTTLVKRAKLFDLVDAQVNILCNNMTVISKHELKHLCIADAVNKLKNELPQLVYMCDDMRYLLYSCHCSNPECIKTYLCKQALARAQSPPKCRLKADPCHICTSSCSVNRKETRPGY
jgi:hypothetical protein